MAHAPSSAGAGAPPAPVPPGAFGVPYLGDTIPLLTDTLAYVAAKRARHGDVWRTRFMGQRVAVAIGADAQRQVLEDNVRFPAAPGYVFVRPLLGNSLFALDGAEHERQRRFMTPAFAGRHYPAYLERINRVLDASLASWTRSGSSGRRTFHRDALAIMFAVSCSLAAGIEVGADYERLLRRWLTMQAGLLNPIRVDVPGTPWHASLAARRGIRGGLLRVIRGRRAAAPPDGPSDILGLLLEAQAADPTLTDDRIVDHLILVLFAGYETTAGAVSWLLIELLRHPDVLARVRAEVRAGGGADEGDAPVRLGDLSATPYLDATIKETLRLHPAQHLSIRGVSAPWTFAGRTVPAGWSVVLAPIYTHRMPEYFADPDGFDPERFLPPREEGRKHPYALIEFGGGAHACLGSGIARLLMKAIVTRLLRRFDIGLVPGQDFRPIFIPAGRPRGGARITYHARGNPPPR